jgi:hypothetical protein
VYIFRDDGTPLLTRYYGDQKSISMIDGLVTPFLAVITAGLEEMSGEGLREINLGDRFYLIIESFDKITCAFVAENKSQDVASLLQIVARQFYKKYRNVVTSEVWDGNTSRFNPFITEIDKILGIDNEVIIEELPKRPLDTFALTEYEGVTQVLLKTMIRLGECSAPRMSEELNEDIGKIYRSFEEAVSDGYLGRKRISKDQLIYFTL